MNESGSQPDVLLQAWDAWLSRSGHVGQLVPKLQLLAEGACNDFNTRPG